MSLQTDMMVQNLQKEFEEIRAQPNGDIIRRLEDLELRIRGLEDKYKMLNARVGWKKE